jgi:ketosteroid isomerase-like protein
VKRQTDSQVGAVEQIAHQLGAAFNARDPVALAALYADNAVLMPPSEPSLCGNRAIRAWFEQALPRLGAISLSPTGTRVESGLAVQIGTFQIQPGTISSSATAHTASSARAGKYVLVLSRVDEEWKICWDLWNLDQPAVEGPS